MPRTVTDHLVRVVCKDCEMLRLSRSAAMDHPWRMDPVTQAAIEAALDDEREAEAYYHAAMKQHGHVRPFSNLAEAEHRHAERLIRLLHERGATVPADPWSTQKVEVPDSFEAACELAARKEEQTVSAYEALLERVDDPEVRAVFMRLQEVSAKHHLPALRDRGGGGRRH